MALPSCTSLEGCFQDNFVYPAAGCAPSASDGEIKYIYIGSSDLDTGLTAEFTSRIDNTGVAADHIIRMAVIGTMNEPDQTEFDAEGGVKIYGTRTFVVEFEKYEDSDLAYEFMRAIQCDNPVKVWFGNDEHIFGSAQDWKVGISTVIRMNRVMEGADTLARYTGSFSWKASRSPERTINPDPLTGNTVT